MLLWSKGDCTGFCQYLIVFPKTVEEITYHLGHYLDSSQAPQRDRLHCLARRLAPTIDLV